MSRTSHEKIYSIVKKNSPGRVATYGQIAKLCNMPRQARQVGYALSHLKEDSCVPWQRVVNAKGEVFTEMQRVLLEQEGIDFEDDRRLELLRFQWDRI